MNALVVLLARLSTGLFLILWAYAVHANLRGAPELVNTLSHGFFTDPNYMTALVYGAGAVGVLVILGLVRMLAYPLQALALAAAAASVWQSIADPLGLYLFAPADTNIYFFPMLALFVASLVPLSLWEADAIAIDRLIAGFRDRDGDGDASRGRRNMAMAPMAASPAIAEAAHAEPAHGNATPVAHSHDEHAHDDHGHGDHGHGDHGHGDHGHGAHDAHAENHGHAGEAAHEHAEGHGEHHAAAEHSAHDDHGHGNGHAAHH